MHGKTIKITEAFYAVVHEDLLQIWQQGFFGKNCL
jgi:hypothetical protein